jgi:hypothetical protein
MVNQQIPRQPRQPYHEQSFARPEAPEVLKHAQEDVLREILRFGVATGEAIANRIHTPRVNLHKVFPSGILSRQAPLYELGIRIQIVGRPNLWIGWHPVPFCRRYCHCGHDFLNLLLPVEKTKIYDKKFT